jgi:dephospho-CoA kinase
MALFWVTGSAGTGKSTVCRALKERGYVARDVDGDGLARWTNLETGYVHPKSSVKPEDRTLEFIQTHGWFVPRASVEDIGRETGDKLGFLCGALDNYDELQDLFIGIIALYVDDETLKKRFAARSPREWGTQEHEVKQTLERHHVIYEKWKALGAVVINTDRSQEEVANEVIEAAQTLAA